MVEVVESGVVQERCTGVQICQATVVAFHINGVG